MVSRWQYLVLNSPSLITCLIVTSLPHPERDSFVEITVPAAADPIRSPAIPCTLALISTPVCLLLGSPSGLSLPQGEFITIGWSTGFAHIEESAWFWGLENPSSALSKLSKVESKSYYYFGQV